MSDRDWRDRAACLGADMQPDEATEAEVDQLRALCVRCPVIEQCHELAAGHPAYGVWAGEWWGELPAAPATSECVWCGGEAEGRTYCSTRCRVAAFRARARELSA